MHKVKNEEESYPLNNSKHIQSNNKLKRDKILAYLKSNSLILSTIIAVVFAIILGIILKANYDFNCNQIKYFGFIILNDLKLKNHNEKLLKFNQNTIKMTLKKFNQCL